MAVYVVTGKLGSGKSLLCCWQIQNYLKRRAPVAVNMDMNLAHNDFCRASNDYSRVIRLPDMPAADDLLNIGFGCDHYDESKFGGIFLDEAGIWLNSRKWNSSGRTDLLEFFLYLRKRRWDLWLIVQNIDIVDKQIRAAVAEHVVYCSRSDRYQLPLPLKLVLNVGTLGLVNFVKLPKFHTAVCKYGVSKLSPTADTWYYKGEDYFNVYNTMQEFDTNYSAGIYSILPPKYILRIRAYRVSQFKKYLASLPSVKPPLCTSKSIIKSRCVVYPHYPFYDHAFSIREKPFLKGSKFMRLTKIYLKKMRFFSTFALGLFVGGVAVFYAINSLMPSDTVFIKSSSKSNSVIPFMGSSASPLKGDKSLDYEALLKTAKIEAVNYLPYSGYFYKFVSGDKHFTSADLAPLYFVGFKNASQVSVTNRKTGAVISVSR